MKPDELWEKYSDHRGNGYKTMARHEFYAAINEYREHVRAEAVNVCGKQMNRADSRHNHGVAACAAAIEKMEIK